MQRPAAKDTAAQNGDAGRAAGRSALRGGESSLALRVDRIAGREAEELPEPSPTGAQ